MIKFDLNRGWRLTCLDEDREDMIVDLPHDAMCAERRSLQSRGRHNIGWFEAVSYTHLHAAPGGVGEEHSHPFGGEGVVNFVQPCKIGFRDGIRLVKGPLDTEGLPGHIVLPI